LKEALLYEQKIENRTQLGIMQQPGDFHNGASFWSPRKIRETRELYKKKQRDQERLQH
ncbi:hypothetical protein COCSADRAFT_84863, partial [Bipolaris sorokiniana ND90Pr]